MMILGLVLGLMFGNWFPQSELRIMRAELQSLKEKQAGKESLNTSMLPEVSKMLRVNPAQAKPKLRPTPSPKPLVKATPDTGMEDFGPLEPPFVDDFPADSGDLEKNLDMVTDLWNVRRAQAKELLIENLELTDSEVDAFDDAVDGMNDRLENRIRDMVDNLRDGAAPSPQDGLLFVHDVTGVMLETYEDLDDIFPSDWQEKSTEETDLINFIDPTVMVPLLDLEEMEP